MLPDNNFVVCMQTVQYTTLALLAILNNPSYNARASLVLINDFTAPSVSFLFLIRFQWIIIDSALNLGLLSALFSSVKEKQNIWPACLFSGCEQGIEADLFLNLFVWLSVGIIRGCLGKILLALCDQTLGHEASKCDQSFFSINVTFKLFNRYIQVKNNHSLMLYF